MFKKQMWMLFGVLVVAILATASWPGAVRAQEETGSENFIFVNYIGQELYLDLDDAQYVVPGTDTAPEGGRLALTLPPGEHKYAANVAGVRGSAGTFQLAAGQVVSKAARFEETPPAVENGILVKKPQTYVFVFDFEPAPEVPPAPTPVPEPWQPMPAPLGQSSIAWTNHTGYEVTVDLNSQIYKVPPKANDVPGRLQINVEPGEYAYTVSVPNGSLNGRFVAVAGQVTGMTVTADLLPPPDYDVGEEFELIPEVTLRMAQEDLTGQAAAAAARPEVSESETPAGPATGEAAAPEPAVGMQGNETASPEAAPAPEGLLIKNYAGDTLVFTIGNQTFFIPAGDELLLSLAEGQYPYTASIPGVAKSGTVTMGMGQRVELSVAINVAGDALAVYQQ